MEVLCTGKVCFIIWVDAWGMVLTFDQLQKTGCTLVNRCYLCQESEESMDHFLSGIVSRCLKNKKESSADHENCVEMTFSSKI